MRIDKALENIRAVMESQEIEWLTNNGFDPVPHKPEPRKPSAPKKALSGHFAANRFLGTASTEPLEPAEQEEPVNHEPMEAEIQSPVHEDNTEPEIIEVIKQKDNKHSWLYNEVVKAIKDASGDSKNTKVIAIFVPVVQNGKEFEELPVSETIELSPVDEEAVKIEELPGIVEELQEPEAEPAEHVDEIFPEPMHEPDPELAQAFENIEVKPDEEVPANEPEILPESEELPKVEEVPVIEEVPVHEEEISEEISPELETLPEVEDSAEIEEVPLTEITPLEVQEEDTPQEAAQEVAIEEISEQPDIDIEESPEEFGAGEKLEYTEIPMPDELDDEEVLEENKN